MAIVTGKTIEEALQNYINTVSPRPQNLYSFERKDGNTPAEGDGVYIMEATESQTMEKRVNEAYVIVDNDEVTVADSH